MPALYVIFGLVLIALIVLAVLWYFLKGNKANVAPAADANDPGGAGNEEIDSLVREAERRLGASKQGDRLGNLPIFFLAGDTGSTKTSIMVNAGLEPELLAGLVYRDNTLVPTAHYFCGSRRQVALRTGQVDPPDSQAPASLLGGQPERSGATRGSGLL